MNIKTSTVSELKKDLDRFEKKYGIYLRPTQMIEKFKEKLLNLILEENYNIELYGDQEKKINTMLIL